MGKASNRRKARKAARKQNRKQGRKQERKRERKPRAKQAPGPMHFTVGEADDDCPICRMLAGRPPVVDEGDFLVHDLGDDADEVLEMMTLLGDPKPDNTN